jgi:hypothetical protein
MDTSSSSQDNAIAAYADRKEALKKLEEIKATAKKPDHFYIITLDIL